MKNAFKEALARPDPGDVPLSTGLANLGLGVLAVAVAIAVFLMFGAIAVSFLALSAMAFGLFLWRKRLPYLACAALALPAGILLLAGGGPTVGGFGLGALLGALAILVLLWPIVAMLSGF